MFLKRRPTQKVIHQLRKRGISMAELDALEMFGGDGHMHTCYFARLVKTLEIWEWRKNLETVLKRRFPRATVKIVDSYEEMQRTTHRFDFVSADTPMLCPSIKGKHYEHFDLFPHVFRLLKSDSLLLLNTMPRLPLNELMPKGDLEHIAARQKFYKTMNPSRGQMIKRYSELAGAEGFNLAWWFIQPTHTAVEYLALKLRHYED